MEEKLDVVPSIKGIDIHGTKSVEEPDIVPVDETSDNNSMKMVMLEYLQGKKEESELKERQRKYAELEIIRLTKLKHLWNKKYNAINPICNNLRTYVSRVKKFKGLGYTCKTFADCYSEYNFANGVDMERNLMDHKQNVINIRMDEIDDKIADLTLKYLL